jgi:acyl-CoA ligase (AMP-forming) (exosortase A-associated)
VTGPTSRIQDALVDAAREEPQRVAIVDAASGTTITYGDLARWTHRFAAELVERGLRPGDRVTIFLDKTIESIVALYGTWTAGGVAVPANGSLRSAQLKHILEHSQSRYFVSSERKTASLKQELLAGVELVTVPPPGEAAPADPPLNVVGGNACAAILYTSGSTGLPKGIALSHENLVAGARIVIQYLGIEPSERILSVLPFSFDYGLNQLLTSVARRAVLVLQRSMMPSDICRSLERYEITALAGVPTLWIQLIQSTSPFATLSFPKLRYITNSGGVFPVEIIRRYRDVIPHTRIFLMYGLTEAFRSTFLPPELVGDRPTSIGKAIPECEILVISERGTECRPGEVGELVHAGPTVAIGYWRDEAATAAKFRPHPLRSGEIAVYSGDYVTKDESGFLQFVGRRDEMIKSYGHRMSPTEIEALIYESGLVAEVVVKGRPDPVAGAAVVAYCVPKPGPFAVSHLMSYCMKEMPNHMIPKHIEVMPDFPRTSSGKIDRTLVGA